MTFIGHQNKESLYETSLPLSAVVYFKIYYQKWVNPQKGEMMAQYKHLEIPGNFERYVKDKRQSANAYYRYFLARFTRMFEYKNLPDTIPHHIFDRYLFNNGIALITEVKGKLYCFFGNAGGPQDVYYRPCQFIVANPHIIGDDGVEYSANVTIFENDRYPELGQPTGVLMRNDTEWIGLNPILSRYAYLMAENTLTLRTADVMLRITALLTAPSDKERAAALEYLKSIENGNLGVIGESPFFDGVKLQSPPSNNGSYLTQFIEYQQYLKGSIYNELGLSANYNMKREAIGKGESTLDEDALLPLCDDMLLCRKQDLQRVNEMFGTNIEVSFSSAWLENEIESRATLVNLTGQPSSFGATPPFGGGGDEENGSTQTIPEPAGGMNGAEGAEGAKEPEEPKEEVKEEPKEQLKDEKEKEEVLESKEPGSDEGMETSNSDSSINDLGWSEELHELEEKVMDKIEEPQVPMEGGTDGLVGKPDEETEDDREDNSTD